MDRETTTSRNGSARIEFLDSVRGLAALAVVFSHALGVLPFPPRALLLLRLPFLSAGVDGKAAVTMFFVLSGFVLSRPYLKSSTPAAPRRMYLAPFYVKRITRIFLPFLCALSLSAVAKVWWSRNFATIPPLTDWFLQFWSQPLTAQGFLKQCLFLVHDASQQLMVQDWSLGVELKASALLPFFLFALRRGQRWLLAIAFLLLFWKTGPLYISFIFGILLAARLEALVSWVGKRNLQWVVLCAGLAGYHLRLILGMTAFRLPGGMVEKFDWLGTSFACALILLGTFSSRRVQKVLNHAVFAFLGRISYGVYLLQLITILCVIPWLVRLLNHWGVQRAAVLVPLIMAAAALITIAAATVFYKAVEEPCIRLGHRFASAYARYKAELKPQPALAAVKAPTDA